MQAVQQQDDITARTKRTKRTKFTPRQDMLGNVKSDRGFFRAPTQPQGTHHYDSWQERVLVARQTVSRTASQSLSEQ